MKTIESGELLVSGQSEAKIELKHRPRKVEVRFVGDCEQVPCNVPVLKDEVECFLREEGRFLRKKTTYIIIRWRVSSERTIAWVALGN